MQDTEIRKELNKLKKIFKNIPEDKRKLTENLMQNAAFMAVSLKELQEDIKENGTIIVDKNGNGFVIHQENPAQKSYNTMINRYSTVIRQLSDLLPDDRTESTQKAGEALAAFVAQGKKQK